MLANGSCEGMLCHSVRLSLIMLWAGRQQGSKTICHRAIKRQRPHLNEQLVHKCCETDGLTHDVMCFVCMSKRDPEPLNTIFLLERRDKETIQVYIYTRLANNTP